MQMTYQLDWRLYRRPFIDPLRTANGLWRVREGLIVRLTDSVGCIGFGECAPLATFATESLHAACEWIKASRGVYHPGAYNAISMDCLPALSYALAAAERMLHTGYDKDLATVSGLDKNTNRSWPVCALLPAGQKALEYLPEVILLGYETFKWKIGVEEISKEMQIADLIVCEMPRNSHLRLDANGGLNAAKALAWCEFLASKACNKCVFIEQPLPVGCEEQMAGLQAQYRVPIALDESFVSRSRDPKINLLQQIQQWSGYHVIKPSLIGANKLDLDLFRQIDESKIVFSSAFETDIGIDALLALANAMGKDLPAIGLDTVGAFEDNLNTDRKSAWIDYYPKRCLDRAQAVWDALG